MKVRLFGPLLVSLEGRDLGPRGFGGVKPKEVLEILLLARGHLVSKEALADALWPDAPPKNVAATLETYVSVIRRHLHEERCVAKRLVVTAAGAYRLPTGGVDVDLDRFDDLLKRAERAGRSERIALREEAVALASGDILEDAPYATWVQEVRQLYRVRVARSHLLLAEDLLVGRDAIAALRHGEEALRMMPLAEEAFRVVMLANHALGHGDVARQVFERCRALLAAELDVDPTTETTALAGLIDAGAPVDELIACVPATEPEDQVLDLRGSDRRAPDRHLPFLGRHVELKQIRDQVAASRAGRFTVVVVHGRPGIGRTTLLNQLEATLPGPVGRSTYAPLEHELPTLPLSIALQHALEDSRGAGAARAYAQGPWLGVEEEALAALCDVICRNGPMVLLLDDLQWADEGALVALEWLRRNAPTLPLTVVAAMRTEPSCDGSALVRGPLAHAEHVRLRALDPSDFSGLGPVGRELAKATGGDPRLLTDCWRWAQSGGSGSSPSMRHAVLRVVRGLGGSTAGLLRVAAAFPQPFEVDDLVRALGSDPDQLIGDVQRLCELDLLEQVEDGIHFRAPIVRSVLVDLTTPDRTRSCPVGVAPATSNGSDARLVTVARRA